MKYQIEIEIADNEANINVKLPTKLMSALLKTCATALPKPVDIFFAASFGVVQVLGPKRFFEVAIGGIKQALNQFLRRNTNHAGTDRRAVESDKGKAGQGGLQDSAKGRRAETLEKR